MKKFYIKSMECCIPKNWCIDEEDSISIYDSNGYGSLTISILSTFDSTTKFDDTIISVASNFIRSTSITLQSSLIFNCDNRNKLVLYGNYKTKDDWHGKMWFLGKYPKIIVATYIYKIENKNEIKKIEKIIKSIKIKENFFMKVNDEQIYLVIKKVIDEWDPVGFLADGAPDDEYDFESKEIADNLMKIKNTELLKNYIYDLFLKNFGDLVNTSARNLYECKKIANLILTDIEKINK